MERSELLERLREDISWLGACETERQIISHIECAMKLLKEQEEERRWMLNWLGKFCRHIDNGDKWLPDEENIAFFREEMKRQFGWDVEDDA